MIRTRKYSPPGYIPIGESCRSDGMRLEVDGELISNEINHLGFSDLTVMWKAVAEGAEIRWHGLDGRLKDHYFGFPTWILFAE